MERTHLAQNVVRPGTSESNDIANGGVLAAARLLTLSALGLTSTNPACAESAKDVLDAWRRAVQQTQPAPDAVVHATFDVTENGMPGTVEIWVHQSVDYRRAARHQFEQDDVVISQRGAQVRDWDGFVREADPRLRRPQAELTQVKSHYPNLDLQSPESEQLEHARDEIGANL